jgi:hypothetical protein
MHYVLLNMNGMMCPEASIRTTVLTQELIGGARG